MDFLDALRLLWRRRLIVVLGILVTGLGCGAVIVQVQTVYQASAQYLLLLPSKATGEKNPQNPLVNQPAGLIIGASLIAAEINTKDTVRDMAADGFESDFSLALAPQSGPLLTLEVTDTDPAAAVAQRDEILRRLDHQLTQIQTKDIPDIPPNQIIHSLTAAVNQDAEAVPGAKVRALVMVVAAGGLLTLLAAFVLDGPLGRRAARRRARKAHGAQEPAQGPAPSEDRTAHEDPPGEARPVGRRPRDKRFRGGQRDEARRDEGRRDEARRHEPGGRPPLHAESAGHRSP